MSGPRATKLLWAAALAALSASACIDTVVVGNQQDPGLTLDAAPPPPAPDAEQADDAGPGLDSGEDAAPPEEDASSPDTGPLLSDSGLDDGGPIVLVSFDAAILDFDAALPDAGCSGTRCAPDASPLGPCASCNPANFTSQDSCPDDLPGPVCWEDGPLSCSMQCPDASACSDSADCRSDEYCNFSRNDCGAGGRGWCAPRPRERCTIGKAVCGCDGERYENGCFAAQAGTHTADDETLCP